VTVTTQLYPLADTGIAMADLRAAKVRGRAVIVP